MFIFCRTLAKDSKISLLVVVMDPSGNCWICKVVGFVMYDKCNVDFHCSLSRDRSGLRMIGFILFLETAHKNSRTGRRMVQALTSSDDLSNCWNSALKSGMSAAGSVVFDSQIVLTTSGV